MGTYVLSDWPAYGDDARGRLRYDTDGNVWVILDVRGHSIGADELLSRAPNASGDEFVAYSGTYEIDSLMGTIVHNVEIASRSSWVGSSFFRWFRLEDDRLTLSINPEFRNPLTWRRIAQVSDRNRTRN